MDDDKKVVRALDEQIELFPHRTRRNAPWLRSGVMLLDEPRNEVAANRIEESPGTTGVTNSSRLHALPRKLRGQFRARNIGRSLDCRGMLCRHASLPQPSGDRLGVLAAQASQGGLGTESFDGLADGVHANSKHDVYDEVNIVFLDADGRRRDYQQMVDIKLKTFEGRFDAALAQCGLTRAEFARFPGIGQANITNWKKRGGVGQTSGPRVRELLGVSLEWLNSGHGEPFPNGPTVYANGKPLPHTPRVPAYSIRGVDDETFDPSLDVLIDVVDVELSAGNGRSVPEFRKTRRQLAFSIDWVRRKRFKESALKVMPVHGDSMLPKLADGDTVLINTDDTRIVDGKIYALMLGREAKIKTLRWRADGSLIVISENKDKETYPDEVIPPADAADVYIIGRAVQRAGDL